MAAASDRAEVDTARPFRSVREAVAVFGDRILVGESHSRPNVSSVPIATSNANASASAMAKHEASSSSSTITLSPNPMAESEAEAMPAVVPMYSAPSSPPSLASSPSPNKTRGDDDGDGAAAAAGLTVVRSIEKLEQEVAETQQEVAQLRKRSSEMEMAVASLNAQLHRGLSKLAEMEVDTAARRSIGGDTDVASTVVRSERYWGAGAGDKLGASEYYLPSFSHALSLGELDDDDDELIGGGGRRRKVQKVKPIVPLIGDILFSKRKSTKEKGDGLHSGDLYSVIS